MLPCCRHFLHPLLRVRSVCTCMYCAVNSHEMSKLALKLPGFPSSSVLPILDDVVPHLFAGSSGSPLEYNHSHGNVQLCILTRVQNLKLTRSHHAEVPIENVEIAFGNNPSDIVDKTGIHMTDWFLLSFLAVVMLIAYVAVAITNGWTIRIGIRNACPTWITRIENVLSSADLYRFGRLTVVESVC